MAGVVSFGIGCAVANTPGIYTSISSHLNWIRSVIGCPFGFKGSDCKEDINECESPITCSITNSRCVNTIGSYICKCNTGLKMEHGKCVDWGDQITLTCYDRLYSNFKCILNAFKYHIMRI